jgi:tetratricopeptide (TPR) repeat protein
MFTKYLLTLSFIILFICAPSSVGAAQGKRAKKTAKSTAAAKKGNADKPAPKKTTNNTASKTASKTEKSASPAVELSEDEAKAKFETILKLPLAERIEELKKFIDANPRSSLKSRASENLTSARAALGDERLQAGDAEGGVKLFQRAVAEAPTEISDKLFVEVISQLPANLFIRGEREAAFELARVIEKRVETDAKRLLVVAAFYLSVEQPAEAARLAEAASRLAPDMAAAHLALGRAHRIALQLDKAEAAFRRALQLDAQSAGARYNLADLARAAGKPEEALALYRQLLTAAPQDRGAQNGVILSLFESGKREEAEKELETALAADAQNLPLLVGAAWWYLSQNDMERASKLAAQAVQIEPRYTWAQIVFARTLIAQKRPLDAEQSLRFARQYGRFPTLDYELANALAAAGLYEEAAEELAQTFSLRDGQIETRLAGRTPVAAENFIELLAAERRASVSQPTSPDTPANARMLKGLLKLYLATADRSSNVRSNNAKEDAKPSSVELLKSATDEFVSHGAEAMRAFRQIYAAARLAKYNATTTTATPDAAMQNATWQTVLEATDAAMSGVEAALNLPVATVAVVADELRDVRARANASGASTNAPDLPRTVLSNIMRGRVEDLAGWALFNQGKTAEAVVRLRRATSVLPPDSPWSRTAHWHLGNALEANGNHPEALNAYLKSYTPRSPDPARRAIIERVYRRINGSLEGLDAKLGADTLSSIARPTPNDLAPATTATTSQTSPVVTTDTKPSTTTPTLTPTPLTTSTPLSTPTPLTTSTPSIAPTTPTTNATPTPTNATTPTTTNPAPTNPTPMPPVVAATPDPTPTPTPTPDVSTPAPPTDTAPAPLPTPTPSPTPDPTPTATPPATPTPTPEIAANTKPTTTATPTPEPSANANTTKQRVTAQHRVGARKTDCTLALNQSELTINQGASALVTVSLDGSDKLSGVKAATPDWAHIIILSEPRNDADKQTNSARYTISSIGKTAGVYTITFTSACGAKEIKVTVK